MEFITVYHVIVGVILLTVISNNITSDLVRPGTRNTLTSLLATKAYKDDDAMGLLVELISSWSFPSVSKRTPQIMVANLSELSTMLDDAYKIETQRGVNLSYIKKMRDDTKQLLVIYSDKDNISKWIRDVKTEKLNIVGTLQEQLTTSFNGMRSALNMTNYVFADDSLRNINKTPFWAWIFAIGCISILIITKGGAVPGVWGFSIAGLCLKVSKVGFIAVRTRVFICTVQLIICWLFVAFLLLLKS